MDIEQLGYHYELCCDEIHNMGWLRLGSMDDGLNSLVLDCEFDGVALIDLHVMMVPYVPDVSMVNRNHELNRKKKMRFWYGLVETKKKCIL